MRNIYFILLLVGSTFVFGCNETINGNGNVTTQTRTVDAFDGLRIDGFFEIELINGEPQLEIVTDENLHEHIVAEVKNGELKLHTNNKHLDGEQLLIRVFYKDLKSVEVGGAVEMRTENPLKSDILEIGISGAGELDMELDVNMLEIDLSGGSELALKGRADRLDVDITGAAEVDALELATLNTEVDITGAGEVDVWVKENLNISITGAGEVSYKGDPHVSQDITGAGEIKQLNK